MTKIHSSLPQFKQALDTYPHAICCNSQGEWEMQNPIRMFLSYPIRVLLGDETQRLKKIVDAFSNAFCELEAHPESVDLEKWMETLKKIETILAKNSWKQNLKESQLLLKKLNITLETRLQFDQKKTISDDDLQQLIAHAKKWKPAQKYLEPYSLTEKEENDLRGLKTYPLLVEKLLKSSSLRNDFFKWVIQDKHLVDPYALFAGHVEKIRRCYLSSRVDHQPIPALKVKKLSENWDLTLPFLVFENGQKQIKEISILDGEQIVYFGKTEHRTIKQIFRTFANKNNAVGELEILHYADGKKPAIGYYHLTEQKSINDQGEVEQLDLSDLEWYLKIPTPWKMSLEETKKYFEGNFEWDWWLKETACRFQEFPEYSSLQQALKASRMQSPETPDWNTLYNAISEKFTGSTIHPPLTQWLKDSQMRYEPRVDGKNWIEFGAATRKDLFSKDFDGAHGMLGFGIPNDEGTEYRFFFIGKFAKKFPNTWWEKLTFFCGAHDATFEISDTNYDYLMRQMTFYSVLVHSSENVKAGLETIRQQVAYARENKIAFQYQVDGCSKFPQEYINGQRKYHNLPSINATRVKCSKARPTGIIGTLHWIARSTPFIAERVQMWILFCFAPWRSHISMINGKEVQVSFFHSEEWRRGETYMPSYIHWRQIKEIKKIQAGHTIRDSVSTLPGRLLSFLSTLRENQF